MTTYQKSISETIGVKETKLKSDRTYSGGQDIITRHLCSIWKDSDTVSTTWNVSETLQKDE